MLDAETASSAEAWAAEEFGHAELGDPRRTRRLTHMAAQAVLYPSGKVSEVFQVDAHRQGAYDFLESRHIDAGAILEAIGLASARRCAKEMFVFVAIDGTSLTLTDHNRSKDFGAVGTHGRGTRGLKVVCGLAVDAQGVPCGLTSMQWWARDQKQKEDSAKRKLHEKELGHWANVITETSERLAMAASGCCAWYQLDREADAWQLLLHLSTSGHWFTVRGKANRRILSETGASRYVFDELARSSARKGSFSLWISAAPGRTERTARMSVHVAAVTLSLRDGWNKRWRALPLYAVRVFETSSVPAGEPRIDWLLYTNHPVETLEDAMLVAHGYSQRWRIEDFFRTWKTGQCNVESTQLQGTQQVKIWGSMLAAIATRTERLKHLARTQPDLPATEELATHEVEALVLLKRKRKKKNEQIPDGIPPIALAVQWIAELGGYTGKSSGGPPGSVTISRGLERLAPAAEMLRVLRENGLVR
ncbi:MAG TPA: IS4 family transposase [Polyangium sp.]|nr:IS4 family transposase [Polyangium sp.]